jgi:hypothetical protein
MARLKLKIKWKRVVVEMIFLNPDDIDRTRMARILTDKMHKAGVLPAHKEVLRPNVNDWILGKKPPPDIYVPFILRLTQHSVLSYRKPYTRKVKPVYARPVAVQKGGK